MMSQNTLINEEFSFNNSYFSTSNEVLPLSDSKMYCNSSKFENSATMYYDSLEISNSKTAKRKRSSFPYSPTPINSQTTSLKRKHNFLENSCEYEENSPS